jgi:hypothetical protein
MLTKLNNFIIDCSLSGKKTAMLIAGFSLTMWQLQVVTRKFPAVTDGYTPFDMQNRLTVDQIFIQLASYTDEAFSLYTWFQLVDYFFPVLGAFMMAAITAFSIRTLSSSFYKQVVKKRLLLIFLIPAAFDLLENLGFLWVISVWPEQSATAANFALTAKLGKLASLFLFTQPLALLLLLMGGSKWLYLKAKSPG